jgi:hypothetical protein
MTSTSSKELYVASSAKSRKAPSPSAPKLPVFFANLNQGSYNPLEWQTKANDRVYYDDDSQVFDDDNGRSLQDTDGELHSAKRAWATVAPTIINQK